MYLQNKYTTWYNNIIIRAKSRSLPKEIYTERHHIIPKSLGGSNNNSNLVNLTAREHFVCHLLLPRMLSGKDKRNMTFAIWSMLNRDHSRHRSRHKVNSHTYQRLKVQVALASSQLHKGKIVSEETKQKISVKAKGRVSPNKGKPMSEDQRLKISLAKKGTRQSPETIAKQAASRTGQKRSEETKQKMSKNHGYSMLGKHHTAETKQKMSNSMKGRPNANKGKPAFNRGVPHTPETILKIKQAHQNREKMQCPHCNKLIAKCNFTRWHGDNCKSK